MWPFGKKKKAEVAVKNVVSAARFEEDAPAEYIPTETDLRLLKAAQEHNVEGIKACLAEGANPNVRLPFVKHGAHSEFTPLMLICGRGPEMLEGVQALIAAGADVNATTTTATSIIRMATWGSCRQSTYKTDAEPLIDALVAAGAKLNDNHMMTVVGNAVNYLNEYVSVSAIKALLKHGASPNGQRGQKSVLYHLCKFAALRTYPNEYSTNMEAIKAMVEAGATLNPQLPLEKLTDSSLGVAALNNAGELVHYLLSNGADANLVDTDGMGLVEKLRMNMAEKLEKGQPVADIFAIIEALETSILRAPDGKGKNGSTSMLVNTPSSHHHIG